jgi:succinate dehydrogenase membrane anchor subunit
MRFLLTGLRAWVWQRLSAVYLLAFLGYVLVALASGAPVVYQDWRAWVARPAVQVAAVVFFAMLLVHAWVGLRNIILDYARSVAWRTALLGLVALALLAQGAWAVRILWSLSAS